MTALRCGFWAAAIGAGLGAAALATPATACVFVAVSCIGSHVGCNPGPSAERTQARERSLDMTRSLHRRARMRLDSEPVDFAAELSELLVPNVRPVWATETDCGLMGEIDFGRDHESYEYNFARLTAGTPLAGRDHNPFRGLLPDEEDSFGQSCNAEFRRGFAFYLQSALEPEDLQQAWLFLVARKRTYGRHGSEVYSRLMRFEGEARVPPVRWQAYEPWLNDQIRRFVTRDEAGRALATAMDGFWSEKAGGLGEDRQVCPQASGQWEVERARRLAEMMELAERRPELSSQQR